MLEENNTSTAIKPEIFTVARMQGVVVWIMTACSLTDGVAKFWIKIPSSYYSLKDASPKHIFIRILKTGAVKSVATLMFRIYPDDAGGMFLRQFHLLCTFANGNSTVLRNVHPHSYSEY
jgi:hypothetical protein